jgi:nicotinamide phosphoribosyltransferase
MLEQYPDGFMACVSDSFDIYRACAEYWGTELKEKVLARDGVLVVRPDSGDPPTVVNKVLDILGDKFGFENNAKGFKVLHPKVRVIQGDGIDFEMLEKILHSMKANGWSADNVAFGSGGGLLQKLNRDTQKFAFKCSQVVVGDEQREVYKRPITGGDKASKRGRLKLKIVHGAHGAAFHTVPETEEGNDLMQTVFENGHITREHTFDEIRRNAMVAGY